jgi:hypothetical protein
MIVSEERMDATMKVRTELLRLAESQLESDGVRYRCMMEDITVRFWTMERVCQAWGL